MTAGIFTCLPEWLYNKTKKDEMRDSKEKKTVECGEI
jgi:hypothetical protein